MVLVNVTGIMLPGATRVTGFAGAEAASVWDCAEVAAAGSEAEGLCGVVVPSWATAPPIIRTLAQKLSKIALIDHLLYRFFFYVQRKGRSKPPLCLMQYRARK